MESRRKRGVNRVTARIQYIDGQITLAPIDIPATRAVDDVSIVSLDAVRFARVREFQEKPEILD